MPATGESGQRRPANRRRSPRIPFPERRDPASNRSGCHRSPHLQIAATRPNAGHRSRGPNAGPTHRRPSQVRLGNRLTKALTPAGYKGLIAAFNAQTGRNYVQKQFKNHWDDMKAIYSAWVFYKNKATGLGWDDVKQTITADDDQWATWIAIHKPIKAFRHGPPDCLNEVAIMFEKANVDGLSSVMPGVDNEEVEETKIKEDIHELYEEENETQVPSPVQPSPAQPKRKRPKSAIPCSPSKFKKNNVPKDFKRFVDHVI